MEKKWIRTIVMLLVAAISVMLLLGGCGSDAATAGQDAQRAMPATAGKAAVVYFSWSGHTKAIADAIAEKTGADVYRLEPKEPYSRDYDTVVEQAKKERSEGKRPALTEPIPRLDGYDTMYLGFPNWWGDMPMVLYTFLESTDLSGKNIIVFCSSGGSGFSDTIRTIQELEPKAKVTEGIHIRDNQIEHARDDVSAWLDGKK